MRLLSSEFYRLDVSPLLRLALPLILMGAIESSSPFFATIFLAELGQQELAAGALVRGLFFTLMVVLWGVLTAVSVLVAQKQGEKDDKAIAQILRSGTVLSFLMTPLAFLLLWYIAPIFLLLGQNQGVVTLANAYLHALAWGIVPDFIALVLLQFLIGLGHTRTSMIFMLCWVPLAISVNYILIFGCFGLPKFGIAGIGWGLTISYWVTTLLLIVYLATSKTYQKYIYLALPSKQTSYLKELLQVGVPLGAMYCIEVGFMFVMTLMMGVVGETQLAATQIIMQYEGIVTSVVFSIAQAVTVRMGHKLGEKNFHEVDRTNSAGVFLAVTFMLFVGLCYLLIPDYLISLDLNVLDINNRKIVTYTEEFFILCAIFQIIESPRIALFGSLRALKDTRFTLFSSIIGFWVIALPLGYLLSQTSLAGDGIWWGMITGVTCSVVMLHLRYRLKIKSILSKSYSLNGV